MKILSLCSGYGGLDMAVEQHFSAKTAYWSDVDKTACAVMAARFPNAQPIGDLTTLDLTMLHADIIVAGYPCQPWSLAGNRLGELDAERHLWPYIRNTVGVLRPRFVVLENVAGHLSLGAARVVADLASLGYDAKWALIRASAAGAPHQRKRWFCIATDTDSGYEPRTDNMAAQIEPHQRSVTNADGARLEGFGGQHELRQTSDQKPFSWGRYDSTIRRWERIVGRPAPLPVVDNRLSAVFVEWMMGLESGHVTDIAASRAKALACLGNGVVPQQAALALELLT